MLKWKIGLLICWILSADAYAGEWRLLDIDRLDFTYSRLRPENRDPYYPEGTGRWRDRAALEWDIVLLEYGYWRNNLHTETLEPGGTVKTVGWEWEAGVEVGKWFDVFAHHHSRHVMEQDTEKRFDSHNQFPVEDSYGIRVHILRRK